MSANDRDLEKGQKDHLDGSPPNKNEPVLKLLVPESKSLPFAEELVSTSKSLAFAAEIAPALKKKPPPKHGILDNVVLSPKGLYLVTADGGPGSITLALHTVNRETWDKPVPKPVRTFRVTGLPKVVDPRHLAVSDEGFIAFMHPPPGNFKPRDDPEENPDHTYPVKDPKQPLSLIFSGKTPIQTQELTDLKDVNWVTFFNNSTDMGVVSDNYGVLWIYRYDEKTKDYQRTSKHTLADRNLTHSCRYKWVISINGYVIQMFQHQMILYDLSKGTQLLEFQEENPLNNRYLRDAVSEDKTLIATACITIDGNHILKIFLRDGSLLLGSVEWTPPKEAGIVVHLHFVDVNNFKLLVLFTWSGYTAVLDPFNLAEPHFCKPDGEGTDPLMNADAERQDQVEDLVCAISGSELVLFCLSQLQDYKSVVSSTNHYNDDTGKWKCIGYSTEWIIYEEKSSESIKVSVTKKNHRTESIKVSVTKKNHRTDQSVPAPVTLPEKDNSVEISAINDHHSDQKREPDTDNSISIPDGDRINTCQILDNDNLVISTVNTIYHFHCEQDKKTKGYKPYCHFYKTKLPDEDNEEQEQDIQEEPKNPANPIWRQLWQGGAKNPGDQKAKRDAKDSDEFGKEEYGDDDITRLFKACKDIIENRERTKKQKQGVNDKKAKKEKLLPIKEYSVYNETALIKHGEQFLMHASKKEEHVIYGELVKYFIQKNNSYSSYTMLRVLSKELPQLFQHYPDVAKSILSQFSFCVDSHEKKHFGQKHLGVLPLTFALNKPKSFWEQISSQFVPVIFWICFGIPPGFVVAALKKISNTLFPLFAGLALFKTRKQRMHCLTFPVEIMNQYPDTQSNSNALDALTGLYRRPKVSKFIEIVESQSLHFYQTWEAEALINQKWCSFGKYYHLWSWLSYIAYVACYSTATLITGDDNNDIRNGFFIATLILAWWHLSIELRDICYSNGAYLKQFENYVDVCAFILPIISSILHLSKGEVDVEMVVVSLFFVYLRFLFYFHPYEGFGIYIAIVVGVLRHVFPFILLLFLATFAFAHMFFMLLRPYDDSINSEDPNSRWRLSPSYSAVVNDSFTENTVFVQQPDGNTNMFSGFHTALMATYILLTGDWGYLQAWEIESNALLAVMMALFSFLSVIYLLNLFIGLLSNAIEKCQEKALYLKKKAEILKNIELMYMYPSDWKNQEYFPKTLHFEALSDEVHKKFNDDDDDSLAHVNASLKKRRIGSSSEEEEDISNTAEEFVDKLSEKSQKLLNELKERVGIDNTPDDLKLKDVWNLLKNVKKDST